MLTPPSIPPWNQIHPLVVHFPIALLLLAPVLLVLGISLPGSGARWLRLAAFILVLVGTAGAVVAVMSGEAGEDAAAGVAGADAVLERHEEFAELARNVFLGLAGAFAVLLAVESWRREKLSRRARTIAWVVYLVAYAGGALILANAAHQGGRLVHELGVKAGWTAAPASDAGPPATPARDHDDD